MNKLTDIEKKTADEIVNHAIQGIENRNYSDYGCDLHNALFNEDFYIIGRYQAEQWLIANGGVFNAIGVIQEYEKEQFGETNTDCSEPEKVVNMYVYILGEIVLGESKRLQKKWNDKLTEADTKAIIKELKKLL